jgi:hypothetical protein
MDFKATVEKFAKIKCLRNFHGLQYLTERRPLLISSGKWFVWPFDTSHDRVIKYLIETILLK